MSSHSQYSINGAIGVHDGENFVTIQHDLVVTHNLQGAGYGISNEALIGACFLPQGIGGMGQYRSLAFDVDIFTEGYTDSCRTFGG